MPEPDRRTMILDHAATLFAERGINGCTVRGIAEGVGMLSGSLYHHFDSKDAMVEAIVAGYLEDLVAGYKEALTKQADPRERLHALILVSLRVADEHRHASQIYQTNRDYFSGGERFASVRKLAKQVQRTWNEVIETGVSAGAFRSDVNARVFHRFLRDAVFLASRWYRPDRKYPLEKLAEETASLFLDGYAV